MDLEIINKLYLELSQVATATTFKELKDREQIEKMVHLLYLGINSSPYAIPAWKKAVINECPLIKVEDTTIGKNIGQEPIGNAYDTGKQIVIFGTPEEHPEWPDDDPRHHNCDQMGCGQCHVLYRLLKPECEDGCCPACVTWHQVHRMKVV